MGGYILGYPFNQSERLCQIVSHLFSGLFSLLFDNREFANVDARYLIPPHTHNRKIPNEVIELGQWSLIKVARALATRIVFLAILFDEAPTRCIIWASGVIMGR